MPGWRFRPASRKPNPPPSPALGDAALVSSARVDGQAFAALYERYRDDLLRYTYYCLGDWDEAADTTQQIFVNAIAGLLLDLRDRTGVIPHAYFGWTEGNPIAYLFKFLAFGEGDTAPVCREVLRQHERDPARRPRIHVG